MNNDEYYDIGPLDEEADKFGAKIRIIIGQRSNGKTYQVSGKIVEAHKDRGESGYYVRRWLDDLKSDKIENLFSPHDPDIRYWRHAFRDDAGIVCGTVALTQSEHFKGTVVPASCKYIFLDEMFPETREIYKEFDRWQSVVSTIIRDRDDVIIYMVGNTVRRTSTYFDHYGINPAKLRKGEISLIESKQRDRSTVKIAVEWCSKNYHVARNSNYYFVDTAEENMIIDGDFESGFHYTKELAGVKLERWTQAKKLPLGVEHNGVYYELRTYNGVLMIARGTIAPVMITRRTVRSAAETARAEWYNDFPIPAAAVSTRIASVCSYIQTAIATNRYLAESLETAEIVTEILNGGKK
ncbi:MAG: phage DNA encapsidation protein [Clostridia bacterium]|nr:phage DNA encapsidation protein [Clostridia bacterium]